MRLAVLFLALSMPCALARAEPRLAARLQPLLHGAPSVKTSVTVRVAGGAARLQSAGFRARALSPSVALVEVTSAELARLVALDGVQNVEPLHPLHALLDVATVQSRAVLARQETGLDGSGVLVGLVDTGLDVRHADFRDASGDSRIVALLDLTQPVSPGDANHPEWGSWAGPAWSAAEIDAQIAADAAGPAPARPVTEEDLDGHGTHVAGIAAGNGLAHRGVISPMPSPTGRYAGVAPSVDVAAVRASVDANFAIADVLDGCRFLLAVAAQRNEPLVVNLSLGGQSGAHDGSSNLEVALDELFPDDVPGRVLVVAAGNDGGAPIHAGGWLLDGDVDLPLHVDATGVVDGQVVLDGWSDGGFTVRLRSPDGHTYGPVAPGRTLDVTDARGRVLLVNPSPAASPTPVETSVVLYGPPGASPQSGNWTLRLSGRAHRWDVWIDDAPGPPAQLLAQLDDDERLTAPANAHHVISVGAWSSKLSWLDVTQLAVMQPGTVGAVADFSGQGPIADGRFGPDLLAPGEFVASSLSSAASPNLPASSFYVGQPPLLWADDGVHGLLRGTSQAAPHVAGAVALLLQAQPTLTTAAIRDLLHATAASTFAPTSGFGRLDVEAAAAYVLGRRGGAVDITSPVSVSRTVLPSGSDVFYVAVTPLDFAGVPLGPGHAVAISVTYDGHPVPATAALTAGATYQQPFAATAPAGSRLQISATVDGITLDAHPTVALLPSHHSGCATTVGQPTESPMARPILLLLAAVISVIGRRRRPCSPPAPPL